MWMLGVSDKLPSTTSSCQHSSCLCFCCEVYTCVGWVLPVILRGPTDPRTQKQITASALTLNFLAFWGLQQSHNVSLTLGFFLWLNISKSSKLFPANVKKTNFSVVSDHKTKQETEILQHMILKKEKKLQVLNRDFDILCEVGNLEEELWTNILKKTSANIQCCIDHFHDW